MKLLTALILILALASPMLGQQVEKPKVSLAIKDNPPVMFRALQIQFTAISWADYAFTSWALKNGFVEANPLARWYIDKPVFSILVFAAADVLVHWGLTKLWQSNKFAGWCFLIMANGLRAYVMYLNLRELSR